MAKIGFWQAVLGDVGYYERDAINSNAESISMLLDSQSFRSEQLGQQMGKLFELDHAQSKELAQLRAIVRVLAETIIDMGFDKERLEQRMENALEDLESAKTMAEGVGAGVSGGGPYRSSGAEDQAAVPAKPEPQCVCISCAKTVLLRRTTITERGNICDRCHY